MNSNRNTALCNLFIMKKTVCAWVFGGGGGGVGVEEDGALNKTPAVPTDGKFEHGY